MLATGVAHVLQRVRSENYGRTGHCQVEVGEVKGASRKMAEAGRQTRLGIHFGNQAQDMERALVVWKTHFYACQMRICLYIRASPLTAHIRDHRGRPTL